MTAAETLTPTPTKSRRLATVETISEIGPIEGADAIERAQVRGWDVVVRKDEFAVGEKVVYFEVDSMLDVTDARFAFLANRGVRTNEEGRSGHVLKTARLRGQYSQGLVVALDDFPELAHLAEGDDATDILEVVKWEPPLSASLAGVARSTRPSWISKTDEERLQNFKAILAFPGLDWIATEKIDGSSATFYCIHGRAATIREPFGVCSRNLDLLETQGNTFWEVARSLDIFSKLFTAGGEGHVVVQGEVYGEGIQGNPLQVKGHHFAAFNLIVDGMKIGRVDWPEWLLTMAAPVYDLPFPSTLDDALSQVEILKSLVAPSRAAEGIVWRTRDEATVRLDSGREEGTSFKVISQKYLLKHDL